MKDQYKEIYKRLVDAYYSGKFEDVFLSILNEEFESKQQARQIMAILCGVDEVEAESDFDFMQKVIQSIVNHRVREKIINKINACSQDCEGEEKGKTKCMEVCPLDAIMKDPVTNDKFIDSDKCVTCGRCITVCENHNFMDTPQFFPFASILKEDIVMAIVAPAIAGQFGKDVTLDQLREAFVKVGFTDMIEVAMAADVLSYKEAMEFDKHVNHKGDFMITSCCCPVWVTLMKKVYNDLIPDFSPSVSPMIAMGKIIKHMTPEAKVIFVGPCVAKKAEAKEEDLKGVIDYVLTFEELKLVFEALNIEPATLKGVPAVDYASTGGRLYARSGGVSQAVFDIIDQMFPEKRKLFKSKHVSGVKECRAMLDQLQNGENRASFIEGMGCVGGCVGGPKALIDKEQGKIAADEVAYDSAIRIPVNSEVLEETLKQLGFTDREQLMENSSMFERKFE
ncbi:MAG: [Fe-Fe] hydrogenase large subunit C-terminal domain-containing protein [Clostridiales bacterium]|nr:[Fe-Fe] hydrogenase large subunit C-terminal domain-containing protein [Clostridiales bacterium]